jgi:hypothetical protein
MQWCPDLLVWIDATYIWLVLLLIIFWNSEQSSLYIVSSTMMFTLPDWQAGCGTWWWVQVFLLQDWEQKQWPGITGLSAVPASAGQWIAAQASSRLVMERAGVVKLEKEDRMGGAVGGAGGLTALEPVRPWIGVRCAGHAYSLLVRIHGASYRMEQLRWADLEEQGGLQDGESSQVGCLPLGTTTTLAGWGSKRNSRYCAVVCHIFPFFKCTSDLILLH